MAESCDTGVCGADVPALVGSVLTGTGMTIAQAARRLERGERLALTDVQRRLVERWIETRAPGWTPRMADSEGARGRSAAARAHARG